MIQVSSNTTNALNKAVNVSVTNGCHVEYNMNDLISGVAVTAPEGVITATLTAPAAQGGYQYKPFEKLFPIKSIIDPRRPKVAGIQYMIAADPSLSATLAASGSANAKKYAAAQELTRRLYFSGIKTAYKYWVTPKAASGSTSLTNCILTVSYPAAKTAAANKIVIKFETSHSKPTSWNVKLVNLAGVESAVIYTGTTCPDNGIVNLYYNGSTWVDVEPATVSPGVDISGLKLQINNISTAGGYLGIIEISARLVKDVTNILESFNISQNSSDSINGLVPVGDVTANYLRLSLNAYDKSYDNYDKTNAFNKNKLSLYENITVRPYVIVESERIDLGVFYLDSYDVDEFGEVSINALDGARELQYIKPPDIVTKDMSTVAIIRRLLDSVGFSNYKFNLTENDTSIVAPYYWYTDPQKTVWEHIQDLCKDTQMIAVFDNKDVLQFYPRGYIFNTAKTPDASFRYSNTADGKLANISGISIENVPSVKAIKVMYSPQLTSNYDGDADNLYTSPVVTLGSAALMADLPKVATAETDAPKGVIKLRPVEISGAAQQFYSYAGYLVLGKEIIEYDAIKFVYEPASGSPAVAYKWIKNESDIQSNLGLAKPNTFRPTGEYRIKERNVFNAVSSDADLTHSANIDSLRTEWTGQKWNSETGNFTPDNSESLFTLKEVAIKDEKGNDLENPNNLFSAIPRSMMTIFAPLGTLKDSTQDPTIKEPVPNKIYSLVTADNAKYFKGDNFVIGTNMYFPLLKNSKGEATGEQRTISGIAFSLNSTNKSGYFLSVATTQNTTADKSFRELSFYKIVDGKLVRMADSQKEEDGSILTGIGGGRLYRIDIRANYSTPTNGSSKVLTLRISINNKEFVVVDTSPITITEKIGLASLQGVSAFDYVYASSINESDFTADQRYNPYKGFMGGESTIIKTFGEFIFNQKGQTESTSWVREFGPVAREIKKITARYTTPGFPLYPSLVNNPDVTIAGTSIDSFGMDVYVVNNTGTFTDLANSEEKQFIVVGNSIVPSDPFEYIDPALTDEEKKEIVGFDSTWIQKESEAIELSKFMTNQWSKQQKVVTVETFLNPLIQIGDVVEISYPDNGLYSSENPTIPSGFVANKFVVLSIDSTYDKDSPPTTNISCRSIYT
jgi:hypothetical protein